MAGIKTKAIDPKTVFCTETNLKHVCEYCQSQSNDYGQKSIRQVLRMVRSTEMKTLRFEPSSYAFRTKVVICNGCSEEVLLIFDGGYSKPNAAIQHQPGLTSFTCKYDLPDSYDYYPRMRSLSAMMKRFTLPDLVVHSFDNFLCPKSHRYRFGEFGDTVKAHSIWVYDRFTQPAE